MPVTTLTVYGTQNGDDVEGNLANTPGQNNNSAQYDTTYIDLQTHNVGLDSYNTVTGYVFTLPSELAGRVAADISECYVEFYGTSTVTFPVSNGFDCKLINAAPSGGTFPASWNTGNSPLSMYNAATGVTAIRWSPATPNSGFSGSWTANTYQRGPELKTHLQAAMNAGATNGSPVTVVVRGVPGGLGSQRINTYNSGSNRPRLIIKVDIPSTNGSVTTVAPGAAVAAAPQGGTSGVRAAAATVSTGVAYTNGVALAAKDTTDGGARNMDVWVPQGTPPSGGWPLALWIHGGFFTSGDKSTVPLWWVWQMVARGFVVASVNYRLTEQILQGFEGLASGNEQGFPLSIHDTKVAINFLRKDAAGANTYKANVNRLVLFGYSAGGSIAQMVAYTKGDTATYSGAVSSSWTRPGPMGRTTTGTPFLFDFNQNGDTGIDDFTVRGVFLWAGATNLQRGVDGAYTPDVNARLAISDGRRCYVSRSTTALSSIDANTYNEVDVDEYLNPAAGTPTASRPYLGRTPTVPNFPIAYARGTSDILVTKEAGYDPLQTALAGIGYSGTSPTTNVSNSTGLSYYEVTGVDHAGMESNATGLVHSLTWLDGINTGGATNGSVTVTAPGATVAVASGIVPAPISGGATTTAPGVAAATGTAAASSSGGVTTTAPLVSATTDGIETVVVSGGRTVTAPGATVATGTSTVSTTAGATTVAPVAQAQPGNLTTASASSPGAVTTVAASVAAAAGGATATSPGGANVAAPALVAGTGTAAASASDGTTTTAASVAASPATVTARSDAAVTTVAPGLAAGAGTAGASGTTPGSVQVTAPGLVAAAGTSGAVGTQPGGTTTSAPVLGLGAPQAGASASGGVTTAAPALVAATGATGATAGGVAQATAVQLAVGPGASTAAGTINGNAQVVAPSASMTVASIAILNITVRRALRARLSWLTKSGRVSS